MNAFLADPRRRNLAVLGGIAVLSVALAMCSVYEQSASVAPRTAPTEFFPGLAGHVRQAARIHIVSRKNGAFDVVFKPSKGWVLPSKGDYPASFAEVNKTLVTLAALTTMEPKTASAEWLHAVALDAPSKGGDGTEIVVSDDQKHELAHLIVGKSEDIGDPTGAVGLFVRRPDESQSWLVKAQAEIRGTVADWLDKTVLNVAQARIQSVVVDQPGGASYEVSRATDKEPHFKLSTIPAGRELSSEDAPDEFAEAIADFSFEDVKPARDVDFANPARLSVRTFDGLGLNFEIAHAGEDYWVQLAATDLGGKPDIAKEARTINAHAGGWAYKVPGFKGGQLTATLESLLKPKGAPAGANGLPGGLPPGMQVPPGGGDE